MRKKHLLVEIPLAQRCEGVLGVEESVICCGKVVDGLALWESSKHGNTLDVTNTVEVTDHFLEEAQSVVW